MAEMVAIICAHCGRTSYRAIRLLRSGPMFCNRACRTKKRRKNAVAPYIEICVDGERVYEHRHVASITLGRPLSSDEEVHHIDGDGWNNHPDNLEVVSRKVHASRHPRQDWIAAAKERAAEGLTIRRIANELGVPYRNVWRALKCRGIHAERDNNRPSPVDAQRAIALFMAGHSLRAIGRACGHDHMTVRRMLMRCGFLPVASSDA